ncbi:dd16024d-0668-46ce-899d-fb45c2a6de43 [Thermothielavioides terrestris]|uniref:pectinesterase n=1 Tax=Thermothielavioides terrestris TaxID=2587410 RepID=A0A446BSG3_9PEZI|nr:dd16024d-0668-46ce-899d-fb45c2a6de43 [Thermothielavioides terrestris]
MLRPWLVALVTSLLFSGGLCFSPAKPAKTYALCQSNTHPPTAGCPPGTLYVSATDKRANFTTVQAAIDYLGNGTGPGFILIAPGNYTEQLNVTRHAPLTLLGMSRRPLRGESYADVDTTTAPGRQNDVQIWWNAANTNSRYPDNVYTGVLTIGPTLNATLTGSGPTGFPVPDDTPFGCTDFRAYNIDFRNEYAPYSDGPAHAVGVSRANAGFYSCGLYSWQDTLYIGKLGNAYFHDTIIAGQTDFLYGFGTGYLSRSTLLLRSCGGGITAWKGTNTSADPFARNKYGIYIDASQAIAANASVAPQLAGRCALGRPWNALHRSVFMRSFLDPSVRPDGYVVWQAGDPRVNASTFMATWHAYGPGYNATAERASNVTRVLSDREVAPYRRPVDVFQ